MFATCRRPGRAKVLRQGLAMNVRLLALCCSAVLAGPRPAHMLTLMAVMLILSPLLACLAALCPQSRASDFQHSGHR